MSATVERTTLTTSDAARILAIVKNADARPAKIRTAFLSVTGQDMRASGWDVDGVREAMQTAEDMGVKDDTPVEVESPPASDPPATTRLAKAPAKNVQVSKKETGRPAKAANKPAPKPRPAPKMVETDPKKLLKQYKSDPAMAKRWERVEQVTEISPTGKPLRVQIRCIDPDTEQPIKGEAGKREIKVQDLFQVRYTEEGAKRARTLARARQRAAKAEKE